jgi:alkylhydroperoxidase family enzyme
MARDTWLPTPGPAADACTQALRLRPELLYGYETLRAEIARESGLDPALVRRCAARVRWLLTAEGDPPEPADRGERAVFRFVDKFVRDPQAVDDDDVQAMRGDLSAAQVVGLTEALALLDGFTRVELILARREA